MDEFRKQIYESLINHNFNQAKEYIGRIGDQKGCQTLALLALYHLLEDNLIMGARTLDILDELDCGDSEISNSKYFEAKLYLNILLNRPADELDEEAEKVLEIDPNAVFAKMYLAGSLIQQGNWKEGEKRYLDILEQYPEAKWIYLPLTKMLIASKKYKEARFYISELKPIPIRVAYWCVARILHPYWFPTFLALAILQIWMTVALRTFLVIAIGCLLIIGYSIKKKDRFIRRPFAILLAYLGFLLVLYYFFTFLNSLG